MTFKKTNPHGCIQAALREEKEDVFTKGIDLFNIFRMGLGKQLN